MEKPNENLWEIAKQDVFSEILETIAPLIGQKDYKAAQEKIRRGLLPLARELGGKENAFAQLGKLRTEFEALFPKEVRKLLNPATPEAIARAKKDRAEEMRQEPAPPKQRKREYGGENADAYQGSGEGAFIGDLERPPGRVPDFDQLKPGLVIRIVHWTKGTIFEYELLEEPKQNRQGAWLILVRDTKDNSHRNIDLADHGIVPHVNRKWSGIYRVVSFYQTRKLG